MSHLNFPILAFSTNFCPIKSDLSGNTDWRQASGFKNTPKRTIFWQFQLKNVNVARFARKVKFNFFCDFQTLCMRCFFIQCKNMIKTVKVWQWWGVYIDFVWYAASIHIDFCRTGCKPRIEFYLCHCLLETSMLHLLSSVSNWSYLQHYLSVIGQVWWSPLKNRTSREEALMLNQFVLG